MGDRLNADEASAVPTAPAVPAGSAASAALADLVGQPVVAIGADLVDIDRIRDIVERRPRFVERVYTAQERAYCLKRRDPAERFAARFAAKEAVLKALGTGLGGADFDEIEVVRLESGQPTLRLTGRAADRAAALGIGAWLITLSHSDHVAQAVVAGLAATEKKKTDPTGAPS